MKVEKLSSREGYLNEPDWNSVFPTPDKPQNPAWNVLFICAFNSQWMLIENT